MYYCLLAVVWIYDLAGPKLLIPQFIFNIFRDISVNLFLDLPRYIFQIHLLRRLNTSNTPRETRHGYVFRAIFLDRAVELGSSHLIRLNGFEARLRKVFSTSVETSL